MAKQSSKRIKLSHNEIRETVIKGRFQFAIECLREIEKIKKSENFVFSPSNIYETLLLVYFASKHNIKDGLERILHLPDDCKNDLKNYFISEKSSQLQEGSNFDKNEKILYQTCSDYRCWVTSTKLIKNTVRKDLFKNRLEILNFNEFATASIDYINETLKDMMAAYITNPVKFDEIFRNVDFILFTLHHFKDEQLQEVPISLQEPRTCLTVNPDMYMTEIFYKNQSLFLLSPIAPSKSNGDWEIDNNITRLVGQLENNIDKFRSYLDGTMVMNSKKMEVTYPEYFMIEKELPINTLFEMLDIQTLLESYPHYLTEFNERESLRLGNGVHCAYMKKTTGDIQGSAVTVFCTKSQGNFEIIEGRENCVSKYSFLWLVYDKSSSTIISMGAINKSTM